MNDITETNKTAYIIEAESLLNRWDGWKLVAVVAGETPADAVEFVARHAFECSVGKMDFEYPKNGACQRKWSEAFLATGDEPVASVKENYVRHRFVDAGSVVEL